MDMTKRVDYNAFDSDLLQSLLKKNLKDLAPDEASETWDIIRKLYAEKRRKRRWAMLAGAAALAITAAFIGAAVYRHSHNLRKDNA
jgi:hypothetical protein